MEKKDKKILFIGGAKGTGKSTIIQSILTPNINYLNTGKIYSPIKNPYLFEKELISQIYKTKNLLIIDTHYAGYDNNNNNRLIRGLSKETLEEINKKYNLELILFDLDPNELLNRRLNDSKKRNKDLKEINYELIISKQFFNQYCNELNKSGTIINNYNQKYSRKQLEKIITN